MRRWCCAWAAGVPGLSSRSHPHFVDLGQRSGYVPSTGREAIRRMARRPAHVADAANLNSNCGLRPRAAVPRRIRSVCTGFRNRTWTVAAVEGGLKRNPEAKRAKATTCGSSTTNRRSARPSSNGCRTRAVSRSRHRRDRAAFGCWTAPDASIGRSPTWACLAK